MIRALRAYLTVGDPSWAVRRRMAVATMIFCMAVILLCLYAEPTDRELARSAVASAFLALGAIPSIYSLAGVADDHSKRVAGAAAAPEQA